MIKTDEISDFINTLILREGTFENALNDALDILEIESEMKDDIEKNILEREIMMPTIISRDSVLPRYEIEKGFNIVAGVSRHSIAHSQVDAEIRYFALFLYSKEHREDFLNYLAYFTRLFLLKSFKQKLASAKDEDEIKTIIIEGIEEIED